MYCCFLKMFSSPLKALTRGGVWFYVRCQALRYLAQVAILNFLTLWFFLCCSDAAILSGFVVMRGAIATILLTIYTPQNFSLNLCCTIKSFYHFAQLQSSCKNAAAHFFDSMSYILLLNTLQKTSIKFSRTDLEGLILYKAYFSIQRSTKKDPLSVCAEEGRIVAILF